MFLLLVLVPGDPVDVVLGETARAADREAMAIEVREHLAGYDGVKVSLIAQVAQSYLSIRTTERRLEVARYNVQLQEESVRISRAKFDAGAVSALDVEQALVGEFEPNLPLYESQIVASGLGLSLEYDTRDMPSNAYEGQHFTASALLNEQTLGSDNDYGVYSVDFTSYHHLSEPFVLAWTASGCTRSGDVPLWDACRLNLRGSTATDYMGRSAVMAKAEGRWHFGNRWGAVVFAGAGKITDPIFEWQDFDVIGNYGAGIRFMVSRENRINLRLDYGRTRYDSAVVLAVGEAF